LTLRDVHVARDRASQEWYGGLHRAVAGRLRAGTGEQTLRSDWKA
jgi:hypothetical protein